MTAQAPARNFVWMTRIATTNVASAPKPLTSAFLRRTAIAAPQPVPHHSGLRQRERGEDADDVQMDQCQDVRVEDPDEKCGETGEDDDPVRVDEPVAEVDELPRKETVARQDGTEPRKSLIGRVRSEDEDRERQTLHGVVEKRGPGRRRERRACDLRDDGHGSSSDGRACGRRDRTHPGRARSRCLPSRAASSPRCVLAAA